VAESTAEGPDWMLMPDAGPVLVRLGRRSPTGPRPRSCTLLPAAGRSLGRLHWAGLVHGRPAVRDICWDGTEARFIDLERFRPGGAAGCAQAADVVMFAQTCLSPNGPRIPRWLEAALASYASKAPEGAMDAGARGWRFWLAPSGLAGGLAQG
jgi:hypothetical protein